MRNTAHYRKPIASSDQGKRTVNPILNCNTKAVERASFGSMSRGRIPIYARSTYAELARLAAATKFFVAGELTSLRYATPTTWGGCVGVEWTNFQKWAAQTIEALLNQSHTPTGLDGCDEARGTIVLFRNWRPAFQRREQVGEPAVIFGIVASP